jgi:hypothetical protein
MATLGRAYPEKTENRGLCNDIVVDWPETSPGRDVR